MTTRLGAGVAAALGSVLLGTAVDLGARQAVERRVYVSVLDQQGAPVTDLTTSDFRVREDGMAREVLRVGRATDPMQIAVLADDTQAATQLMADERRGLQGFVKALHQGNEIALLTFGDRPEILVDYTVTLDALTRGINRLFARPNAGSTLLESIVQATRGFRKREARRPVLVVITTEGEEFSNDHSTTVLDELLGSRAQLHAIIRQVGDADAASDANRNRSIVLADGTLATGGRRDYILADTGLTPKLQELAAELKNQYLLVYARTKTLIPPKALAVSVSRPGLTTRAGTRADLP